MYEGLYCDALPQEAKAFYMRRPGQQQGRRKLDLLAPAGFWRDHRRSVREDDYEDLLPHPHEGTIRTRIRYLDLRKYGSVPHGGFCWGSNARSPG